MKKVQNKKKCNSVVETIYTTFFMVLFFCNINVGQENSAKVEKKWFDRILASEFPEKQDPEYINLSLRERLDLALSQNVWPDQFVVDGFVFDLMSVTKKLSEYPEYLQAHERNIESWKVFLTAYVLETDPEKYTETQIETVNRLLDGFIPECMPPNLPQEVRDILRKTPKDLENDRKEFLIRLWETTIACAVVHADPKNKHASYYGGGFNDLQRQEFLKLLPTIFPDFLPEETKELINKPPEYFLEDIPGIPWKIIKSKYQVTFSDVLPLEIDQFVDKYLSWMAWQPGIEVKVHPGPTGTLIYPEGRYVYPEGRRRLAFEKFGVRSFGEGIVVVRYHDQDKITVEPFSEKYLVKQDHILRYDKFQDDRFFGNILYIIDDSFVPEGYYPYYIDIREPPVLRKAKEDPQPKPVYEFQLL